MQKVHITFYDCRTLHYNVYKCRVNLFTSHLYIIVFGIAVLFVGCSHCASLVNKIIKGHLTVREDSSGRQVVEIKYDIEIEKDRINGADNDDIDIFNMKDSLDEILTSKPGNNNGGGDTTPPGDSPNQPNIVCGPLREFISFCCPDYKHEYQGGTTEKYCEKQCQINARSCIYEIVEECQTSRYKPIRLRDICMRYPQYGFKPFVL